MSRLCHRRGEGATARAALRYDAGVTLWRPYGEEGPSLGELTRQALSSTDRGYDLLAPRFDATPFRTPDAIVEAALAVLGSTRVKRGLDVGCGTGAGLARLRERCDHVVGVDRSAGMLHEARARFATDARVSLVQGDALDLPFGTATFDVACSFGAFGHIRVEDEARFVRNVQRVLAPGGRFVFVTAEPPPFFSRRHLVARAFNGVMRLRNAVRKPEFVMYYLTFLLPRARRLLEEAGFEMRVQPLGVPSTTDELGPRRGYVVVEAVRR